jgi:hypothetical protein
MTMSTVFLACAVASALWGTVLSIRIARALEKHDIHVNVFQFRAFFFRYLDQYKKVTGRETGRPGPLYYSYITAMNVALVCAIIGLILRAR